MDPEYEPLDPEEREGFTLMAHTPMTYEEAHRLVIAADQLVMAMRCCRKSDGTEYTEVDIEEALCDLEKAIQDGDVSCAMVSLRADSHLTGTEILEDMHGETDA
jgi:hypothetical protein